MWLMWLQMMAIYFELTSPNDLTCYNYFLFFFRQVIVHLIRVN